MPQPVNKEELFPQTKRHQPISAADESDRGML